ncbi:MAG: ZIP family metal transporter [Coprobacillus sp.]|nr:ZIP family metal transporter [Coprobacillus sp.]
MSIWLMLILGVAATVLATGLGALIGETTSKHREWLNFLQNFSTGALIGFVFIDLLGESITSFLDVSSMSTIGSMATMVGIIIATGLIFFALHELLHHFTHHHEGDQKDEDACEDHGHIEEIFEDNNRSVLATSFVFLAAIFIHNIPEGFATGVAMADTLSAGLIITVIMFIHNFVIGLSMYLSFKNAGKGTGYSVMMSVVSSIPAYALLIAGYFSSYSGAITSLAIGIVDAVAFGALLYVIVIELLPQIFTKYKSKYSFIYVLVGLALVLFLLLAF